MCIVDSSTVRLHCPEVAPQEVAAGHREIQVQVAGLVVAVPSTYLQVASHEVTGNSDTDSLDTG